MYTLYTITQMTACRSMLWCNTRNPYGFLVTPKYHNATTSWIPKRGKIHFPSSKTLLSAGRRTRPHFEKEARQNGNGFLCGVVVASYAAGNSCYIDREESEDEKRRKNMWWSCHLWTISVVNLCSSPFSPHSPTRSLKQDSDVCGGG